MDPIRRTVSYNTAQTLDRLHELKARLREAEEQAETGRKVSSPEDAPELWIAISRLRAESYDQKNYAETASRGLTWLAAAETSIRSVTDLLKKIKERAIQFGNEAMDPESRIAAANEMNEIYDEMVALANTQIEGRFIFSGTRLGTEPFDGATAMVAGSYLGAREEPTVQVGRDSRVSVGFDGEQVFQGTINTFEVIQNLQAALAADDPDAVRGLVDSVQAAFDQAVIWTEEVGFRSANIDDAVQLAESMEVYTLTQLDSLVSADPAEAYMSVAQLRTTYESAMQVIGQTLGPNLFHHL
jgi:flagellar hook-associated protein 3 FlgL